MMEREAVRLDETLEGHEHELEELDSEIMLEERETMKLGLTLPQRGPGSRKSRRRGTGTVIVHAMRTLAATCTRKQTLQAS